MMLKSVIKKMPYWVQKPIIKVWYSIPDGKRLGREFKDTYNFIQQSQWWTKEQHEEYQMRELQKLLKHAYDNVPYYKKIFDERGLKPKDIQNLNDLKQLPYLTKEIVRNNLKDLIAQNYHEKELRCTTTGGSTGIPMVIYIDKKVAEAREWAFMTSQWSRVGYDIYRKNKCVILRGNIPRKGFYEYVGMDLILSSFHMTEKNMKEYIKMIENFNPDFIQAYPSSISILTDFILQNDIKLRTNNLKSILCGSETLYDFQREKINKAFKVRVYSWYGHSEKSCLAGECEKNNHYHFQREYGYTQLINSKGEECCEEGELGEIVCTGFNNYAMPFIRYRTGDIAVNTNEKCSCGRSYKLIKKIQGRMHEFFVDKTGALTTFICSVDAIKRTKSKVRAYQYVQNKPGEVILNIECKDKLIDIDIEHIKKDFLKFYQGFSIQINVVEHIERTPRGKFIRLIQNIPINFYNDFKH